MLRQPAPLLRRQACWQCPPPMPPWRSPARSADQRMTLYGQLAATTSRLVLVFSLLSPAYSRVQGSLMLLRINLQEQRCIDHFNSARPLAVIQMQLQY